MILRILGEGQYDLPEVALPALQDLDAALEAAVDAQDDDRFHAALSELLTYVRQHGRALADEDLDTSDAILPGEDARIEEVRALLLDDGIVPG